jgi:hypothetical protein
MSSKCVRRSEYEQSLPLFSGEMAGIRLQCRNLCQLPPRAFHPGRSTNRIFKPACNPNNLQRLPPFCWRRWLRVIPNPQILGRRYRSIQQQSLGSSKHRLRHNLAISAGYTECILFTWSRENLDFVTFEQIHEQDRRKFRQYKITCC